MDNKNLNEKIIEALEENGKASLDEILELLSGIKRKTIKEALEDLMQSKKIDLVTTKANAYYILVEGITVERFDNLGSELKKIQIQIEDELIYEKIEVKKLKEEINRIYLNFLTMIAVFVSIFALIYTNTNIIYEITNSNLNLFVSKIIIINVSVTVMILVLIVALRLIIINSLKRK